MAKFHELFIKTNELPEYLGKMLNETFEKRQFGDYDVDANISKTEAEKVLKDARLFLDAIRLYFNRESK